MAPLRAHLVGCRRYCAGAADARRVRCDPRGPRAARCRPSRARAEEHRHTPMIGRTHGVHAEPMTFGLKLALWYAEIERNIERVRRVRGVVSVGKISGAVGTFAHLPPSIEADVCRRLGLEPAPVSSQVIQRDRHAELMTALAICGASLEKFALEIRGLQKTEIGEVEEPFAEGAEGLLGDAAQAQPDRLRADRRSGAADARQRHGGARERRALARARHLALLGGARDPARHVHRARPHAAAVHAHRRRHGRLCGPHAGEPGALARRRVLRPGPAGSRGPRHLREQAYTWVQRNAMRAFDERRVVQGPAAGRRGHHAAC